MDIEGKDNSELNVPQIVIDRVRHFRRLETPSLMKCIDEITFHNIGKELSSVEYILDSFRPSLHIFDSNRNQLEFHGDYEDGNEIGFEIQIDFPKDKAISKDEFKTISLEYIIEVKPSASQTMLITVPLHETASVYVFLEHCENYDFSTIHYGALDDNYNLVENADLITDRGESFWYVVAKGAENNSSLLHIIFKHKITKALSSWIKIGIVLGCTSLPLIYILYHFHPSNIMDIIMFAGFIISFLFIIKGWLFSKNMEKSLIMYDSIYRALVLSLFAEIAGIVLHYNFIL